MKADKLCKDLCTVSFIKIEWYSELNRADKKRWNDETGRVTG